MAKPKDSASKKPDDEIVQLIADRLLVEMAEAPERVEYNTRVLGGMFQDEQVAILDRAYTHLVEKGWAAKAGAVAWFFGSPKLLVRITQKGLERAEKLTGGGPKEAAG